MKNKYKSSEKEFAYDIMNRNIDQQKLTSHPIYEQQNKDYKRGYNRAIEHAMAKVYVNRESSENIIKNIYDAIKKLAI